jgi:translation initiation factor IF-3
LVSNDFRINDQIRAKDVRLVSSGGEMIGIVPLAKAIGMARAEELDLVEISPNSEPPVCKITDYGKIKYQTQKKAAIAKKKQKVVENKEIKLSTNIAQGDYDTKIKQARGFFERGNKVRFSFQFRGREIVHADLAKDMAEKIIEQLSDVAKVDIVPQMEGKKLFFVMVSTLKK